LRTTLTDVFGFSTNTDTIFQITNVAPQVPPMTPREGTTPGEEITPGEETTPSEQPQTEEEGGEEGAGEETEGTEGTTQPLEGGDWIWWVIGILVIVVIAGYFFLVKK